MEELLYNNSLPRPPEGPNSKISDATIKSFSPSPIPVEDSDSLMEEIDIFLAPDDSIPPCIKSDDYDSEDIIFFENLLINDPILFPEYESFTFDVETDVAVVNVSEETIEISPSLSLPFGSEDKVFNLGILTSGKNHVYCDDSTEESQVLPTRPTHFQRTFNAEILQRMNPIFNPGIFEDIISFVIRIFLPFFTYVVISSFPLPFRSEDTIFDPGISTFRRWYHIEM
ncbi:hypothetical protein Tco_1217124 [Tanacetum coccineum]